MSADNKAHPMEINLDWKEGLQFEAQDVRGLKLPLDGDTQAAFSPTEALLASLCSCLAIDVVMILQKMRLELGGLSVQAQGERNGEHPRYFRKIQLLFQLEGDLPEEKVERAIDLSFEKYCSVLHTLRRDIEISRRTEIRKPSA